MNMNTLYGLDLEDKLSVLQLTDIVEAVCVNHEESSEFIHPPDELQMTVISPLTFNGDKVSFFAPNPCAEFFDE